VSKRDSGKKSGKRRSGEVIRGEPLNQHYVAAKVGLGQEEKGVRWSCEVIRGGKKVRGGEKKGGHNEEEDGAEKKRGWFCP